ncbi:MAG: tRNA pseudouridine(55) synthase TruB [Bacteroidetes bacterium]|nr:tRNA pseudouridine(55) synthase TruB [Bacteroidota bacterium]
MSFNFTEGEVLLIDKPIGWTSFDVVNKIRNAIRNFLREQETPGHNNSGKIKVGHAGTLDPLATGLLIVCTGKFTKRIDEFMAQEKEYTGEFTFGASTPTYDAEMPADATFACDNLSEEKIIKATESFVGTIQQIPPMYSAIKQEGKKLYELARKGVSVELKPREVFVKEFELSNFELPKVNFRIVCSKGTYIRSIAHDLGKAVDNGAYLSSLRRTRIGDHKIEDALQVMEFVERLKLGN